MRSSSEKKSRYKRKHKRKDKKKKKKRRQTPKVASPKPEHEEGSVSSVEEGSKSKKKKRQKKTVELPARRRSSDESSESPRRRLYMRDVRDVIGKSGERFPFGRKNFVQKRARRPTDHRPNMRMSKSGLYSDRNDRNIGYGPNQRNIAGFGNYRTRADMDNKWERGKTKLLEDPEHALESTAREETDSNFPRHRRNESDSDRDSRAPEVSSSSESEADVSGTEDNTGNESTEGGKKKKGGKSKTKKRVIVADEVAEKRRKKFGDIPKREHRIDLGMGRLGDDWATDRHKCDGNNCERMIPIRYPLCPQCRWGENNQETGWRPFNDYSGTNSFYNRDTSASDVDTKQGRWSKARTVGNEGPKKEGVLSSRNGKRRLPLQRYDPRKRRRTKSPEPEEEKKPEESIMADFSGAEEPAPTPQTKPKRIVEELPIEQANSTLTTASARKRNREVVCIEEPKKLRRKVQSPKSSKSIKTSPKQLYRVVYRGNNSGSAGGSAGILKEEKPNGVVSSTHSGTESTMISPEEKLRKMKIKALTAIKLGRVKSNSEADVGSASGSASKKKKVRKKSKFEAEAEGFLITVKNKSVPNATQNGAKADEDTNGDDNKLPADFPPVEELD